MTEEECRRDDEMMREKRRRQALKNKELSFIDWWAYNYLKESEEENSETRSN